MSHCTPDKRNILTTRTRSQSHRFAEEIVLFANNMVSGTTQTTSATGTKLGRRSIPATVYSKDTTKVQEMQDAIKLVKQKNLVEAIKQDMPKRGHARG